MREILCEGNERKYVEKICLNDLYTEKDGEEWE
jgi:hypothetical protein